MCEEGIGRERERVWCSRMGFGGVRGREGGWEFVGGVGRGTGAE